MKSYALITGASKGIGLEFAKLFAKDGYNLILVARSKNILNEIKEKFIKEFNIDVVVIESDLSIPHSAKSVYEKTKELNLRVDYLINNAGFGDFGYFLDADIDNHYNMVQLNILSLMELTKYYGMDMKNNHFGKILNVGSIGSFFPGPLMATYYATKAFVLSFSEALAKELKDDNVKVTVLCPGTTRTNFFNVAMVSKEMNKMVEKSHPAAPEDVAKYGYVKMMKGKVVAIHGIKTRTAVFMSRFVSRRFARNIVFRLQNGRNKK